MWLGLAECVAHWGDYDPERVALVIGGVQTTYASLCEDALHLSNELTADIRGKRVAVLCREKKSFVVSLLGALFAGARPCLFNPKHEPEQLRSYVKTLGVGTLITDLSASEASGLIQGLRCSIIAAGATDRAMVVRGGNVRYSNIVPRGERDEEWGVLFSSGTTGVSKPIVHTHYSMMSESLAWCIELSLRKDTRFYIARPLYYTGGFVLFAATLMVRGVVYVDDHADDDDLNCILSDLHSAATEATRVLDWLFLVPEQARQVSRLQSRTWPTPGNPRSVLLMGSKISVREKQAMSRYLGSHIVESWGNTEGLGTITEATDLDKRPESIGRPFLSEPLFILSKNGDQCGSFEHGFISGSDETMFQEYAEDPTETSNTKKDGALVSQDIGFTDNLGYFYIVGREIELISTPSGSVSYHQIEEKIRANTGFPDCAISYKEGSDVLFIYLVPFGRAIDEQVLADLREIVFSELHRVPAISVRTLASIPLTPSGKINRGKITTLDV